MKTIMATTALVLMTGAMLGQTADEQPGFGPALKDAHGKVEWCDPSLWMFGNSGLTLGDNDGFQEFICVPDDKGPTGRRGHMAEWFDAEREERKELEAENRQAELAAALTQRVLTPAEMSKVLNLGYMIYIHSGQSYFEDDLRKKFQAALDVQKTLREMQAQETKGIAYVSTPHDAPQTVNCATTLPPPWDANCNHIDPQQPSFGILYAKPQDAPQVAVPQTDDKFVCSDGTKCQLENGKGSACVCTPTSVTVTVCGKYQHAEAGHMSTFCQNDVCMDGLYVPAHCVDDLHTVTEAEWQELKKHVSELEKPLCVKKAGMVWELWDCKVAPPKKAVAPSHPPAK